MSSPAKEAKGQQAKHSAESRLTNSTTEASFESGNALLALQSSAGNQALNQLMRAKAVTNTHVPNQVKQTLSTAGQPLDRDVRADMESRFGADFSDVRVHADAAAAESARAINARAYTVGTDVVFGAGHYHPRTGGGAFGFRSRQKASRYRP